LLSRKCSEEEVVSKITRLHRVTTARLHRVTTANSRRIHIYLPGNYYGIRPSLH